MSAGEFLLPSHQLNSALRAVTSGSVFISSLKTKQHTNHPPQQKGHHHQAIRPSINQHANHHLQQESRHRQTAEPSSIPSATASRRSTTPQPTGVTLPLDSPTTGQTRHLPTKALLPLLACWSMGSPGTPPLQRNRCLWLCRQGSVPALHHPRDAAVHRDTNPVSHNG